jgi:hypothetical protein
MKFKALADNLVKVQPKTAECYSTIVKNPSRKADRISHIQTERRKTSQSSIKNFGFFQEPHGLTSQKKTFFIFSAVKTSKLANVYDRSGV